MQTTKLFLHLTSLTDSRRDQLFADCSKGLLRIVVLYSCFNWSQPSWVTSSRGGTARATCRSSGWWRTRRQSWSRAPPTSIARSRNYKINKNIYFTTQIHRKVLLTIKKNIAWHVFVLRAKGAWITVCCIELTWFSASASVIRHSRWLFKPQAVSVNYSVDNLRIHPESHHGKPRPLQ